MSEPVQGAPVFDLSDATFRYPGLPADAVSEATFTVEPGQLRALLGPNGSGKSTLLKVMLGELTPSRGRVAYEGHPVREWKRRALARRVAFVPQAEPLAFPMTVRELVAMGRYPHVGVLGRATSSDTEAVERALAQAGVTELADRPIPNLSGGERQRARIARALAQEPATLVLDEPTASLDMHFEMETFELLRDLTFGCGLTVVVATHNLNLASRFASDILLMSRGRVEADGPPREVFTHHTLERVFQWPVAVTAHPGPGPDTGAPQVLPLSQDPLTPSSSELD